MMHSIPAETHETLWRTLQTFGVTRIVIAIVLLAYVGVSAPKGGGMVAFVNWQFCIGYLSLALLFVLVSVYWQRRFMLQLLAQVGVDIAAISVLYVAAGGASSGLGILYLFPLAGGAILAPLILALFFCSVVTFIMLAETGFQLLHSTVPAALSRAGLSGAAFFAAVFVINRLAERLIKQESLAAQRGRDLQQQEAINRLVIADMGDGILVVGRGSEVIAGNPALERMLGLAVPPGKALYKLTDIPSLAPIADAFFAWQKRSGQRAAGERWATFVRVKPGGEMTVTHEASGGQDGMHSRVAHLRLRFADVKGTHVAEDRTVIFLQDVTEIENQAQQLKLASMGRLTASIAHEVRNPLSAISHAASLLGEDIGDPTQKRLLNIVNDNVVRLNRMIEDILKLSRKAQSQDEPVQLTTFLTDLVADFTENHALAPGMIALSGTYGRQVRFDPLHLREVIVNLLSNALRYASGRTGSIRIHALAPAAGRLELHVQDDGPPISPAVRAHLFEPFYTTSSKGTGLGLYVARELCLNNGAMLDYEYRADMAGDWTGQPGGRFVITFAVSDPL